MENQTTESSNDDIKKLGELINDVKIAMLNTMDEAHIIHSSPLMTQEVDADGTLWFLISKKSHKVHDIQTESRVNLTYASSSKFISINGTAELVDDSGKIQQLWSNAYLAYFPDGRKDENIQLLKVNVEQAEYWEGHSSPISKVLEFVKIIGGKSVKMGEHGKLDLHH